VDDRRKYPRRGSDPAGVRGPDDPGNGVGQQHRYAVGGEHGQPDARQRRDDRVGSRAVGLVRPRYGVDHSHPVAVDLIKEHHGHAEFRGEPSPVGRDVTRNVTHPEGEVERRVRSARPSAGTRRNDSADPT
jgi:hypothetical protein